MSPSHASRSSARAIRALVGLGLAPGGRVLDRSLRWSTIWRCDPRWDANHASFELDPGVRAQPVTLVDKGLLKDYVRTRRPRKNAAHSNGHARSLGGAASQLGAVAMPSTLVLSAGAGASSPELVRARFLDEIKARDLPFGLIVRKLDDDSIVRLGATDALDQYEGQLDDGRPSALTAPIAVWKLFPDGREARARRALGRGEAPGLARCVGGDAADGARVDRFVLVSDFDYTRDGPLNAGAVAVSAVAPGMLLLEEAEIRPQRPLRTTAAARPAPGGVAKSLGVVPCRFSWAGRAPLEPDRG